MRFVNPTELVVGTVDKTDKFYTRHGREGLCGLCGFNHNLITSGISMLLTQHKGQRQQVVTRRILRSIPGVYSNTGQSIGLPIALPGPGELEGEGGRPGAASPDPGRAVGNPIDCPVLE